MNYEEFSQSYGQIEAMPDDVALKDFVQRKEDDQVFLFGIVGHNAARYLWEESRHRLTDSDEIGPYFFTNADLSIRGIAVWRSSQES